MPKNVYFGKKAVKSPQHRGLRSRTPGGSPQTFALLLSPTAVAFAGCICIIEQRTTELTNSKCFGFVFLRFRAYFSIQTLQFLLVERRNIFCPRSSGTLAMPLIRLLG